MAGELAERVVIITGAAGGVGTVVTRRWRAAGASVLAVGNTAESLASLGSGDRFATAVADVASESGAGEMVAAAERAFGRPADTLIHLVGGFAMGPIDAPDAPKQWASMLSVNLNSAFFCYRAVLDGFRRRGGGWIVGLGSRVAVTPGPRLAAYAASKAGLVALTQSLSEEVKAEGIHVNVLLASTIDTPANRRAMGDKAAGSWVSPDDIADATLYLCSERARAIYGATLEVYARA
jgi:NAD(P)-dependent dehydrogenase (short-subunit alcohol dehydrogenase family)